MEINKNMEKSEEENGPEDGNPYLKDNEIKNRKEEESIHESNQTSITEKKPLRKLISEINGYYRILTDKNFLDNFSVVYDFKIDLFSNYDMDKQYDKGNLLFILSNKILEEEIKDPDFKKFPLADSEKKETNSFSTLDTQNKNNIKNKLEQFNKNLSLFMAGNKLNTGENEYNFFNIFQYDHDSEFNTHKNKIQTSQKSKHENPNETKREQINKEISSNSYEDKSKSEIGKKSKTSENKYSREKGVSGSSEAKEIRPETAGSEKKLEEEEIVDTKKPKNEEAESKSGSDVSILSTSGNIGKKSLVKSKGSKNENKNISLQIEKNNHKQQTTCLFFLIDFPSDKEKKMAFIINNNNINSEKDGFLITTKEITDLSFLMEKYPLKMYNKAIVNDLAVNYESGFYPDYLCGEKFADYNKNNFSNIQKGTFIFFESKNNSEILDCAFQMERAMLDYYRFVRGTRKIGLLCLSFKEEEGKYIHNKELIELLEREIAKIIEIRKKHGIEIILINIDKEFCNMDNVKTQIYNEFNINLIKEKQKSDQIALENLQKYNYDIQEERKKTEEERKKTEEERKEKLKFQEEMNEWKRKYEEVMKKDTKQLKITNNFLEMPSDQDNDN